MSTQLIIYATAAEIIKDFLLSKNSLKNLCYAPAVRSKKQVYALVLQTLKYRPVLTLLLTLAQVPGFKYHELARLNRLLAADDQGLKSEKSERDLEYLSQKQKSEIERYETEHLTIKKARLEWHAKQQQKQQEKSVPTASSPDTPDESIDSIGHDNDDDTGVNAAGDATGITSKWCPSYVTYIHNTKQEAEPHSKHSVPRGKGKTPMKRKLGSGTDTSRTEMNDNIYQYPIEAMLVIAYDVLFGSGLPKLGTLLPDGVSPQGQQLTHIVQQYTLFQRGVLDAVRLFHIPNPPRMLTGDEIALRANLTVKERKTSTIRNTGTGPSTAKRAPAEADVPKWLQDTSDSAPKLTMASLFSKPVSSSTTATATSTSASHKKKSKARVIDALCPTYNLTFPIDSQTPTQQPWVPLTSFPPDFTFRQRLTICLQQLEDTYRQQFPDGTQQSSSVPSTGGAKQPTTNHKNSGGHKRKNYEFLLPKSLQDKYQRVIPRYIRINTNKTTYRSVLETLDELGYQQLTMVPRAYRLPLPKVSGFSPDHYQPSVGTGSSHKGQRQPNSPEGNESDSDSDSDSEDPRGEYASYLDYYDPKHQGHFDEGHQLNRLLCPSTRIGSDLWHLLNLSSQLPDTFDLIEYKERSVIPDHPSLLHSTLNIHHHREYSLDYSKHEPRNFWVDSVVPDLLCFSPTDTFILGTPMVKQGQLIIQDRASCFPPLAIRPALGSTVIDGCSAPGNKTSYLSSIMQNTGKVYAIEINSRRAETMQQRLSASDCSNVEVVNTSFFDISPTDPKYASTEYIMLDPSCSGSGNENMDVLLANDGKSHPEESEHVQSLGALQLSLLQHALSFPNLKALAYSTCSIYATENELVVDKILPLAKEHGFELIPALPLFPGRGEQDKSRSDVKDADMAKCVRVDPDLFHSGGFFLALFAKSGVYNTQVLDKMLECTKHRYGLSP